MLGCDLVSILFGDLTQSLHQYIFIVFDIFFSIESKTVYYISIVKRI